MKHTAQTLKWFLGMDVFISKYGSVARLDSINIPLEAVVFSGDKPNEFYSISLMGIYPILETAEELGINGIDQIRTYFGEEIRADLKQIDEGFKGRFDVPYGVFWILPICAAISFIEKGYGAIPNEESPTGYVDFINHLPCVTPKQVKEGVKL